MIEREELIELRLDGNEFVLALRIDTDRLNAFHRHCLVVHSKHFLVSQALDGFGDPYGLVCVVGPLRLAKVGSEISVKVTVRKALLRVACERCLHGE